jgi:carbohydrate binding protein with CBM6 domain/phospholipase D-like protein
MYRISQDEHANGMIRAIGRGIPVRLITEEENYRDTRYIWHSYNVDRMWAAGVDVKQRYLTGGKAGITHQKSVILYGQKQVIFGSSNWSSASATQQFEHNLFSAPCTPGQVTWCDGGGPNNNPPNWFFNWFVNQFNDKWNSVNPYNFTEFLPFKPRPGGTPVNKAPANGAVNVGTSGVVLKWDGGNWNHKYDVYLSQTSTFTAADKIASDIKVGSPYTGQIESWTIPATITLQPGTTYFWRVVGKTMGDSPRSAAAGLNLAKPGPTWSFTTTGTSGGGGGPTPYGGTPANLPGIIQAENFDNGGPGVAYFDTTSGNSGGKFRQTDVDIAATTDTGGGYNLGYTVKGEWLRYTVNVTAAGTYTLRLRYANVGSGATVHVSLDGTTNLTGPLALQNTGGWQVWTDLTKPVTLPTGPHVLTLVFDTANQQNTAVGNINYLSIQ